MVAALAKPPSTEAALGSSKALMHGLEILGVLAESGAPMTSTEIARRVGMHQSSASRILRTLRSAGYVRKPDYHSFAADYGLLTLCGRSVRQFPVVHRAKETMLALAERSHGLTLSLAILWHGQVMYLLRTQQNHEPIIISVGGFPLHLSSPAMRLLLDCPEKEALEVLNESQRRYGWDRPTERVPGSPKACLKAARALLRHDCLPLAGWQGAGRLSASIALTVEGEPPLALAISGSAESASIDSVLLLLQEGRHALEPALR